MGDVKLLMSRETRRYLRRGLTIRVQRMQVSRLLRENPSLQPVLRGEMVDAYTVARLLASNETGLDETAFPENCPVRLEQVLDENYWPD